MSFEEDKYFNFLVSEDEKGIKLIYKDFLPRIESILGSMGASKDESWEIFQESLIVVLQKAQKPDFQRSSSFFTFLVSVCKFKWFNESKKKYKKNVTISDAMTLKSDDDIEESVQKMERFSFYQKKLKELDPLCQQLFQLFFQKVSLKEIAKTMGLRSENAAKQRKYKCQKKLIENIKKDQVFKQFI